MEISKTYNPAEIEDKWYQAWMKAKIYKSTPDEREPYTITIPPPNVTGILHMGHMLNNTLQDVLIRRKRMQGYNACWVPGTDHASIATEAKVVAMLKDKGIDKKDLSREEFLKYAFEWKEKYGGIILAQLRKLGASCDWDRTSFTMDKDYSKSVIKVFCQLYEEGLIYRGVRMVNWDPAAQTAVSDEEVDHKETQGNLYHVRYRIDGSKDEYITIATTRPETILGDTAIAVHPEDERYHHLKGKFAIVPLVERKIPIIQDSYVDKEFGTGCLKVTPAHDINDYEIGLRHNLESIDVLADDGTISEAGQLYVGEDRFVVRKKITKELKAKEHLIEIEPIKHSVGYSERTKVAIEPKLSTQWFLNMKEISKPALEAVVNGEIELIPGKFINTYKYWMENVHDWCLSRQLWWGHQIPAYFIKGTQEYVVAETPKEALEKAREKTGKKSLRFKDLEQDPDVLDTWASSWLWPISVFNGLTEEDSEDFNYYYPTNDLVTAPEILFFWVARMIIAGYHFKGQKPFSNVYLHGIVRDDQRRKMSKSLGNSPDPIDLINQYGADGTRVGMLMASPAGNDLLYKEELVLQGRNFANKIWNALRLVKGWKVSSKKPADLDMIAIDWMEARYNEVLAEIEDHFDKFRLSDALMSVYKLIWDDFCSWFLEMIKPDYGKPISRETINRTRDLFDKLMKVLHPFMPFISEEIYHLVRRRSKKDFIAVAPLEVAGSFDQTLLSEIDLMKEVITAVRAFRAKQEISPKEQIELFIKSEQTETFAKYRTLLEKFLNTAEITFVEDKPDAMNSINVRTHELFIPMGEIDVEAEMEKVTKQIERKEKLMKGAQAKLGNERFVSNAPAEVVEKEKQKLQDAQDELTLLRDKLRQLESMQAPV